MRSTMKTFGLFTICVVLAAALVGCASDEPTAVDPAKEQVEEQTDQQQASVDEALNSAQAAVSDLADAVGGLEARVDGLQINSDLQEVQRKLTNAIGEAGDKKVAALDELSSAFDDLIAKVETAAEQLPEGGAVQTELTDFATKLKTVQADLATAAASAESSGTTSP